MSMLDKQTIVEKFPEVDGLTVCEIVNWARTSMIDSDENAFKAMVDQHISSEVAEGRLVRVPEVWPDDTTHFFCHFFNAGDRPIRDVIGKPPSEAWDVAIIGRPSKAWKPKVGEWVWWVDPNSNQLARWSEISAEYFHKGYYALGIDLNAEKDWTWEQFQARGDCCEIK